MSENNEDWKPNIPQPSFMQEPQKHPQDRDERIKRIAGFSFNKKTAEEQREISSKGGKASVEVRRAKRNAKEAIRLLIETQFKGKSAEKVKQAYNLTELTYLDAMIIKQIEKAISKGDTTAFKELLDRVEGKAVQKNELTGAEGKELSLLKEEDKQIMAEFLNALNKTI